jgi:hypothetical protein
MIRSFGIWKGGKFSIIVCKETGGIALAFYHVIAKDRVKRHFVISYVYMSSSAML